MLLNCGVEEDSWESFRLQGNPTKGNQSRISSLEGLMLKLKLQYYGQSVEELTHLKRPWCWERLKVGEKGTTEDEMVGWHHWLNGHEFEQALGVGDGHGGLACCSPWGHKESDTTERLNWTELIQLYQHCWLYLFFTELPLYLCWNSTNHIWWMYFYTLYSLPLIYLSILIPIPYISISVAF